MADSKPAKKSAAKKTSAKKAAKKAASATPAENREKVVGEDAKEPTQAQADQLQEAGEGNQPPPADQAAPKPEEAGVNTPSAPEDAVPPPPEDEEPPVVEGFLENGVVRHADQVVGKRSSSAYNVHLAFELKPKTEWSKDLDKRIRAFQKEVGQRQTGYLTRDQCRRLGLSYIQ